MRQDDRPDRREDGYHFAPGAISSVHPPLEYRYSNAVAAACSSSSTRQEDYIRSICSWLPRITRFVLLHGKAAATGCRYIISLKEIKPVKVVRSRTLSRFHLMILFGPLSISKPTYQVQEQSLHRALYQTGRIRNGPEDTSWPCQIGINAIILEGTNCWCPVLPTAIARLAMVKVAAIRFELRIAHRP